MYSMVLMMAMSTTPDITTHGGGCNGCSGSSCNGCSGSSCNGCSGGKGGFLGMKKGGGCSGGFLGGFIGGGKHKGGSCNGCSGSSCHGCNGSSCHGAVIVHPVPANPCETVPLAPVHGTPGVHTAPPAMSPEIKPEPKKMPAVIEEHKKTMAPANIELNVPFGSKVTMNGQAVAGIAQVRYFRTRDLDRNATEVYTVAVEVVRDGKTLTATEKLTIKGGETTTLSVNPQENNLVSK
jgi:uncharacterized protein (TIGR03000 family)